jgi:hypothetical protein
MFAGRHRMVRYGTNSGTSALFEAEHVIAGATVALDLLSPSLLQRSSERRQFAAALSLLMVSAWFVSR